MFSSHLDLDEVVNLVLKASVFDSLDSLGGLFESSELDLLVSWFGIHSSRLRFVFDWVRFAVILSSARHSCLETARYFCIVTTAPIV